MEGMNYITPTLYFQQGDELCFQTPIPHHTHIIQDMLATNPPMLVDNHQEFQIVRPKSAKPGAPILDNTGGDANHGSKKKKLIHRDVERQRRHEMSMLYSSLRSHLPVEYLKGKRSISDHMNEAANYIKHLQKKIQEHTEKRDRLRRVLSSSSNSGSPHLEENSSFLPHITVRATLAGAAVVIIGEPGHEVPLSRAIAALVEEGLNVISVSTYRNSQLVYTLECESDDPSGVDSSMIQQKLIDSIRLSN